MAGGVNEIKVIESKDAPGAVGPYSQVTQLSNLLFTSGQLPIDPTSGKMPESPISVRAHQSIKNLSAIIAEAGASLDYVVKTTVFLSDIADFQEVNSVYAKYFNPPYPARSAVQVAALPLGADIEIEAIVLIK